MYIRENYISSQFLYYLFILKEYLKPKSVILVIF